MDFVRFHPYYQGQVDLNIIYHVYRIHIGDWQVKISQVCDDNGSRSLPIA